jgi:ATP-binding cassette subfamily B protein
MGHGPGPMGALGMQVQKAKDFKGTLRRLLAYLKPQRMKLIVVVLMAMLSTLFAIVSPKLMGNATTEIFEGFMSGGVDFDAILRIVLLLSGLYVLSSVFAYVQQYVMAGVAQKTVYGLRSDVNEKLAKLPLSFFDSRTHGEILSRTVNDVDNISNTLQQSLTQLISAIVTLIGVIVMMLTISPLLTLILLLTLPLSFFVVKAIASRSQGYFKSQQAELGQLNGHVEEMYTGHKIVKAFGREKQSIEAFDAINERLYHSGRKAQFITGIMMPLMGFISNIGYVLISVVGGILVTRQSIKIGDIQAFIQYARQFSQPLTQTATIANIVQSTIASAERVFELLDEKEESEEPAERKAAVLVSPKGDVRFEHVKFGYKENETLIADMNIDVKQGQTVAVVGPTGAGKTTLVNLLMRFYEIRDGSITIDGVNITQLRRGELRTLFGMVLQDTWLFNGTIRDKPVRGSPADDQPGGLPTRGQLRVGRRGAHHRRRIPVPADPRRNRPAPVRRGSP